MPKRSQLPWRGNKEDPSRRKEYKATLSLPYAKGGDYHAITKEESDKVPTGDQQINLLPLTLFVDADSFLYRGKAALGGEGNVVANNLFCLLESLSNQVISLQLWFFGGDQAGNEGGIGSLQRGPGLEGTRTFIIVFHEETVIRDLADDWSY